MKSFSPLTRAFLLSTILYLPSMAWSVTTITTPQTTTLLTSAPSDDLTIGVGGSVNVTGAVSAILLDQAGKNLLVNDNLLPSVKEVRSLNGPAVKVTGGTGASITVALAAAVQADNNIALWVSDNLVTTISNYGTIESKWEFPAIRLDQNFTSLTNQPSGNILSNTAYTGAGIDISTNNVSGTIVNSGNIFGTGSGLNLTRQLTGAIINSGAIQSDVSRSPGINLGFAGLVTGGITNSGSIVGKTSLNIANGNVTIITNTGTLTGDVFLGGATLNLNPGSVLTGQVVGDNIAASSKLILNPGISKTFTSTGNLSQLGRVSVTSGTYQLNHAATDIFDFQVNNANLNLNQNLVFSGGAGSTKLLTLTGSSNLNLTNGIIVGDIKFGTGTVNLSGGSLVSGKITGNNSQQGTLNVDIGAGKVFQSGGNLDQIGFINVVSGTLALNKPVTNGFALTVQPNAQLDINADITLNQGVIKTLEVIDNGAVRVLKPVSINATFKQTGVGTKSTFVITDVANFGQIDLNAQTLNMSKNASIELKIADTYIPNGQSFVILKNVGAFADSSAALIPSASPLLQFTQQKNANDITVVVNRRTPDSLLPRSSGLEGVVIVTDQILSANPVDANFKQLQSTLMSFTNVDSLVQFYQSLVPNQNEGVLAGSRAGVQGINSTIKQRISSGLTQVASIGDDSGYNAGMGLYSQGVWAQIFGNRSDQKKRLGVEGFKSDAYGISVGYDVELVENLTTGVVGGFAETKVKNQNNLKDYANVYSLLAGAYASYEGNLSYTDVRMLIGRTDYEQVRRVALGALTLEATSKFRGKSFDGRIAHGLVFRNNRWSFMPELALSYNLFIQKRYMETGAGALSLTVARESFMQLQPEFGVGLNYRHKTCYGVFKPKAKVMVLQDILSKAQRSRTQFVGGGGVIITNSPKPGQTSVDVTAGLEWEALKDFTVSLNVEHLGKDRFKSQNFSLSTGYRW